MNHNGLGDKKYLKICIYTSVTVILTLVAIYLLYRTVGVWEKIWTIFTAILRPLLIGLILVAAYRSIAAINCKNLINALVKAVTLLQLNFNDLPARAQELLKLAGVSLGSVGSLATGAVSDVFFLLERFFTGMVFGIIFSIYFMLDGSNIGKYWENVFRTVFGNAAGDTLRLAVDDFNRVFSGYLRGQVLDATIVLVISCILLKMIGIPNSILVGVLIGLGNLIPYVGPIVGYVVLTIVCIPRRNFTEMIIGLICISINMCI